MTGRGSDDGDTRSLLDLSSALQGHGLVYFAFDLPHLDGEDKARLPLLEREARFSLEVLLSGAPAVIRSTVSHRQWRAHVRGGVEARRRRRACRLGQPLALDHADPRLLMGWDFRTQIGPRHTGLEP